MSATSDGIGSISAAWNVVSGSTTAYISNSSTVDVEDGNLIVQAIANADVDANVSLADNTGSDLATNGTFDSDTGWIKGTGWTIDPGVASSDGSQVGDSDLSQTILTNAKTYLVTYTISNYNAGTLTAVAVQCMESSCRIFRVSLTIFISSFVYPFSRNTSQWGRQFRSMGCG